MSSPVDRRTVVAGLAGAASFTAAALAAPAYDPAFNAVAHAERCERAYRVICAPDLADTNAPEQAAATEAVNASREALCATVPTTLAGLAAMVAFVRRESDRLSDGSDFDTPYFCDDSETVAFLRNIDDALRAISLAERSAP